MRENKEVEIIDWVEEVPFKCLFCGKDVFVSRPKSSRDGDKFIKIPNYCKDCEQNDEKN